MTEEIAIIAPGAMGSGLAARLTSRGVRVLTVLVGRSPASQNRAIQAGMIGRTWEDIAHCPTILSVVPPSEAVGQAKHLAAVIAKTKSQPLYIDLNATSPQTSQMIDAIMTEVGARYVDGSIMGNPPAPDYGGPFLYVCGPHAESAMALAQFGLNITKLETANGSASALKMAFGGIMKGLTALGAGMLLAASRTGADNVLLDELRRSQPDLASWFERQIPRMYPKTYRWVGEMQEIAGFLGPGDPMSTAFVNISDFFEQLSVSQANGGQADGLLKHFFPPDQPA